PIVFVLAADDHHVAADVRAGQLYDRAAEGRHVALDSTLHDHVAAEGERAVLHLAAHAHRSPEPEHVARVTALDQDLVRGLRRGLRLRARRDGEGKRQKAEYKS